MVQVHSKIPMYLGIDPGARGGLATVDCERGGVARKMPETEKDIWLWFDGRSPGVYLAPFAVIEKVHAMPGNGVSGMFKFGMSYGGLRMALIASGIPFEEVTPQVWQRGLNIPKRSKTESSTEWKNRLKAKAQQLFPDEKVTLATADAILIAEYCRRRQEGRL